jgi:hypothetical protein
VLFSWSKRERDGRGWESLARRVRLVRSYYPGSSKYLIG